MSPKDIIKETKAVLKQYEDGHITESEVIIKCFSLLQSLDIQTLLAMMDRDLKSVKSIEEIPSIKNLFGVEDVKDVEDIEGHEF